MADLDPITRTEMFLAGNEPDLTPITREEVILAGGDLAPVTRKEWFLKKYRGGGDSGGGTFIESDGNLLQGVNYESGYITTSGTIGSAGAATKEITFDPIDVTPGKTYYFYALVPNVVDQWLGVGWYDDSGAFISRQEAMGMSSATAIKSFPYQQFQFTVPSSAKKMRFTCRSYGLAQVLISDVKPNVIAGLSVSAATATSA